MNSFDSDLPRGTENEALIESSFRRLLASIESEREKISSAWAEADNEQARAADDLESLRRETEVWCQSERQKVQADWKRLDKLRERMSVLWPDKASESLEINCSGTLFSIPKRLLVTIEGSYLNHMFSDAFIANIPRDADGRFFFDFNPFCFGHILPYLRARCDGLEALLPLVPPEEQQNLDMLAEGLRLQAYMPTNRMNPLHGTSLRLSAGGVIEGCHPGWQVISATYSLSMASTSYFEVHITENMERRGGLAVGVCGHMPQGSEIHTVRLTDSIMYNSGIGLVGDAFASENVTKAIVLAEDSCIGVKHDPRSHKLDWFYNRSFIGTSSIRQQSQERMLQIFPVVALGAKGQKVEVNFTSNSPFAKGD